MGGQDGGQVSRNQPSMVEELSLGPGRDVLRAATALSLARNLDCNFDFDHPKSDINIRCCVRLQQFGTMQYLEKLVHPQASSQNGRNGTVDCTRRNGGPRSGQV